MYKERILKFLSDNEMAEIELHAKYTDSSFDDVIESILKNNNSLSGVKAWCYEQYVRGEMAG